MMLTPSLDLLPIFDTFREHLGTIPCEITLKTNTRCSWMVKLQVTNRKVAMDQGWSRFAIAHKLQIEYVLLFKVLSPSVFKVIVFDCLCAEVVNKCAQHDPTLARVQERWLCNLIDIIVKLLNLYYVYDCVLHLARFFRCG